MLPRVPPPAAPAPLPTLRRDLLSAYAAAGAKVGSWAAVSGWLYRYDEVIFARLALLRATLGLLNYAAFGLGPATVHLLAKARHDALRPTREPSPVLPLVETPGPPAEVAGGALAPASAVRVLDYAGRDPDRSGVATVGASAQMAATLSLGIGFALLFAYATTLPLVANGLGPTGAARAAASFFGIGILLRLTSDVYGAVPQTCGGIWIDNTLMVVADLVWLAGVLLIGTPNPLTPSSDVLTAVCIWFAVSSLFLLIVRGVAAVAYSLRDSPGGPLAGGVDWAIVRGLFAFGLTVTVAQLADFLYAPTDFILINRLLDPAAVAAYAPAVQVDAALLLLVAGLASVLLPRSAVAHAAGDAAGVRRDYVRGTLASAAMLAVAAVVVWALSPWLFRLWLGTDAPATRAILPGVLVHTVVGGSGAVGRAVLIGTGRVKAFTISVLVAGAANVVLSAAFVWAGLGLWGVVLGTIVVVVARCGVWMPWYTLRVLRVPASPDDAR